MAAELIVKTTEDGSTYHAPIKVYVVYGTFNGAEERITHYWEREQAEKCAVNFARHGARVVTEEPEMEVDRPQGTGRVPR